MPDKGVNSIVNEGHRLFFRPPPIFPHSRSSETDNMPILIRLSSLRCFHDKSRSDEVRFDSIEPIAVFLPSELELPRSGYIRLDNDFSVY